MRNSIYLFLLLTVIIAGCASVSPKSQPKKSLELRFRFDQGARFKTYDFIKTDLVHPNGERVSQRKSTEFRYSVLESSETAGAFLKMEIGEIEIAKLVNNELVASAKATASDGIIKYKEGLDISKDKLLKELKQVNFVRVDSTGRLLAYGKGVPTSTPLEVKDWSTIKGYDVPGASFTKQGDAAFCIILPQQALSSGDVWLHTQRVPLIKVDTLLEVSTTLKANFTKENIAQIGGLGDPTGRIEGEHIQIRNGRQFVQMIFDTSKDFPRSLQSELYVEYSGKDGKWYKLTINYTSNNSIAPRTFGK